MKRIFSSRAVSVSAISMHLWFPRVGVTSFFLSALSRFTRASIMREKESVYLSLTFLFSFRSLSFSRGLPISTLVSRFFVVRAQPIPHVAGSMFSKLPRAVKVPTGERESNPPGMLFAVLGGCLLAAGTSPRHSSSSSPSRSLKPRAPLFPFFFLPKTTRALIVTVLFAPQRNSVV